MRSALVTKLAVLLAAALPAGPAWAAGTADKAQPTSLTSFGASVEVNVVNVDVHVTDKSGKRVNDLRKGDFEILEDGKPVAISNFTPVRKAAMEGREAAPATAANGDVSSGLAVPRAPDESWNLVVYVDNANIRPSHRARALQQLREFLAHNLSPADRVMVVTSNRVLKIWQPFTSDPAALDAALQGIEKVSAQGPEIDLDRKNAFESIMNIQALSLSDPVDPLPCPLDIARPAHDFASSRRSDAVQALNALTLLVNSLSGVPGRKAVLHVSDGIPAVPGEELFQFLVELCGGSGVTSGIGNSVGPGGAGTDDAALKTYDAQEYGPRAYQAASQGPSDSQSYSIAKNLAALVAHANAHQVTLYTLQASGVSGTEASDASFGPTDRLFQFPSIGSAQRASLQESLHTLAEGTGGRAILNANDFRPDLAGLKEDFATFYSLGYTPSHNGDGKEHKVEVRVKRPAMRLRYRSSYRDKPALEKAVDRTLAALLYGSEDNPLQITVEVGDQLPDLSGKPGVVAVPIRLRIPLHNLAILNHDDSFEGSLRLMVATRTEDGRSAPLRQVAVPIKIPRQQVLNALGQFYVYTLTLQLAPGTHRVAVGVRDEIAATTSYLSQAVTVGTIASAKAGAPN